MKKKFSKLMEKDGFYIVLFVCVCIVATTAVWASKNSLNKKNSINEEKKVADSGESQEDITEEHSLESEMFNEMEETTNKEEQGEENKKEENENEEDVDFVDEENEEKDIEEVPEEEKDDVQAEDCAAIVPVEGTVGLDFTKDNLVYSKTLEEWTSHDGIDFYAEEGTTVKASMAGVVKESYEDKLWGAVVILDHGDGLFTKYANLSTKNMAKVGQKVNKGDSIGKVGKTASIEIDDKPHLHFEVLKKDVPVDPKEYIGDVR